MKKRFKYLIPVAIIFLVSLACTINFGEPAKVLNEEDRINTAVANALATTSQQQPTNVPTQPTTAATETPNVPPTAGLPTITPKPCNKALFISETIPDGTTFSPNQAFVKTWRFKNVGTCTWNTNYKIFLASGSAMNSPATKNLPSNVGPEEQVDISLNLQASGAAGSYSGVWKLMADNGEVFTPSGVSVSIIVSAPSQPDLIISEFSLNPPIPTMGQNVHVRVGAYNQGGAAAGAFTVRWFGLSTFASPSCAWALPSMVAHGGQILECNFTFGSWYPINKTTIVYIDPDNQVAESNEGNNSASITPFGVNSP